ncbi:amidohydrolase [Thalassotalea sp. LPB0316]|uniref:amidohydrolase n=1 Tax=Thalassotalea sp. LPB0316 TaxID=2769490 RepID=UPI001866CE6B|nr:amidohydrolase [Thalassotalea sp. LPB0316]QOL24501.1 amidohydrolase [Thalassotalea sp. LPB0316]
MKKICLTTLALLPSLAIAQTQIIYNVNGYTPLGDKIASFNAVAFEGDKITKVYQDGETVPKSDKVKLIDGQGKTLLPGLIDAHGHVLGYGLGISRVNLMGIESEQAAVEKIKRFSQENNSQGWILGRGWNQVIWPSNSFPTKASLDKAFPDQAVWLKRVDGHAGWANSKALALSGITKATKSPDGGEIIKDQFGEPTGVFIDNAMYLIDQAIAPLTIEQEAKVLKKAMQSLAEQGLTSVHDAGISNQTIAAYQLLAKNDEMPIRIYAMADATDKAFDKTLANGIVTDNQQSFVLRSVKISADGALGSRGAALHKSYSDKENHHGLLLHKPKELSALIDKSMQAGFQVNTHAIGDKANTLVLDNYEVLIAKHQSKALRHRVEHAQILLLEDIPRFAELGVIPSMQATHATSDKNMAQDRLGKDRLAGAYAWRKLLSTGVKIANGSDFPVEYANPFFGLHAAVTRQDHNNQPLGGWLEKEKMTRAEALRSFSIDAAYAGHQETALGSIEVGKMADFILVDKDFFNADETTLWQTKVLKTWVGGKQVY